LSSGKTGRRHRLKNFLEERLTSSNRMNMLPSVALFATGKEAMQLTMNIIGGVLLGFGLYMLGRIFRPRSRSNYDIATAI
jgi:hypothetical protein